MRAIAVVALTSLGWATPALAQRAPAIDFHAGWAGFADESIVHHAAIGTAIRFPILGNRVTLGPEIFYMAGPGLDRDVFVNAVLVTNLRGQPRDRRVTVMPYVTASGGLMLHRSNFAWIDEWFRTWNVNAGLGVRGRITDRLQGGIEARVGSQLELRITGGLTYMFR